MKLKVCGLNCPANIKEIVALEIDYTGFIFYEPSPRYFGNSLDFDEARQIPKHIQKVGVFVNAPAYAILDKVAHYDLDLVQLHGNESPAQCRELRPYVKVIKAFRVDEEFDLDSLAPFAADADYFLFDSAGRHFGGNGTPFDFAILKNYNYPLPYFLSGGIDSASLPAIAAAGLRPYALDINSKFETAPGKKSKQSIQQFTIQLNSLCNTI